MGRLLLLGLLLPAVLGEPEPRKVSDLGDYLQNLSWSPDGNTFLFSRIHRGKLGLWTMQRDGSAARAVFPKEANPTLDASWHPDGQRIIYVYDRLQGTDGKFQIDTANADGTDAKNLVPHKTFDESPRWSPDAQWIALTSTRDKNQDIWLMDAKGSNFKRLTSDQAADNSPSWSPDGKRLAFASARSGNFDIWIMNADGSGQKRLTDAPRLDFCPVWAPDGASIAFVSNRDGNYEIYVMTADGKDLRNVSRDPGYDHWPCWSPDSRQLAWVSNRDGGYDVYVLTVK